MRDLELVFGAVDLRVTPDGEFVFFEVNPQGQFLFVEILTGLPISATLARYLARHEKRRGPADQHRNQPSQPQEVRVPDFSGQVSVGQGANHGMAH
jgi:biotin carboxylase